MAVRSHPRRSDVSSHPEYLFRRPFSAFTASGDLVAEVKNLPDLRLTSG